MPDTPPPRRSALADVYHAGRYGRLDRGGAGVTLCERRGLAICQVAAWPGGIDALAAVLGRELPVPGRAAAVEGGHILWIGPLRWWIVVPEAMDAAEALRARLAPDRAAVTDHGHGRTVLRLAGHHLRALLSKGCPLDLHPTAFPAGACAGSLLGPYAVILHAVETESIDLYIARSYAESAWDWLTDAAGEYGYEVLPARG